MLALGVCSGRVTLGLKETIIINIPYRFDSIWILLGSSSAPTVVSAEGPRTKKKI